VTHALRFVAPARPTGGGTTANATRMSLELDLCVNALAITAY